MKSRVDDENALRCTGSQFVSVNWSLKAGTSRRELIVCQFDMDVIEFPIDSATEACSCREDLSTGDLIDSVTNITQDAYLSPESRMNLPHLLEQQASVEGY